jgi:hypothetical protein
MPSPIKRLFAANLLILSGAICLAGVDETISGCASGKSQEARIACLEDALRKLSNDGGGADPPATVQAKPSRKRPLPADAPAPEGTPAAVEAAAIRKEPPRRDSRPEAPATAIGDAANANLGAEQVEARNRSTSEDEEIVNATVVDFDFVGYRRLLVQLDNGQIWRQIDGDRVSVDRGLRHDDPFDVEMWGTRLGGYRMRILPLNRTIRVERLK